MFSKVFKCKVFKTKSEQKNINRILGIVRKWKKQYIDREKYDGEVAR